MASTSRLLQDLEEAGRIEASVLKYTKIHKVMKAITNLDPDAIPREGDYRFISRARDLVDLYMNVLAEDTEGKETRERIAVHRFGQLRRPRCEREGELAQS